MTLFSSLNQVRSFTDYLFRIVLVLAALIAISTLMRFVDFSLDLTQQKKFTLSDYTHTLLQSATDPIHVKLYISKDLPPHLNRIKKDSAYVLKEFEKASAGTLFFTIVEKENNPETELFLSKIGIPKFQANIIEKDAVQIVEAFCGAVIYYEDNKEVIPVIGDIDTLQYDVTLAIKRLIEVTQSRVSILDPTGFLSSQSTILNNALSDLYDFNIVGPEQSLPSHSDCLIVYSPDQLTDRHYEELSAYIDAGGQALFLMDQFSIESLSATPKHSNVHSLLSHYGVSVEPQLLADSYCETVTFRSTESSFGVQAFLMNYPLWPTLTESNFPEPHPLLTGIQRVVFPWTSPITVSSNRTDLNIQTLISTSDQSWTIDNVEDISPSSISPQSPQQTHSAMTVISRKTNQENTQSILVIGSSHFIQDELISRFPGNLHLLLNSIDWLILNNESGSIPQRISNDFPLKSYSEQEKNVVKWGTFASVPILFFIAWIIYLFFRKKHAKI